ncbi:MAG: HK97 family phage prohead protease [bacterium]
MSERTIERRFVATELRAVEDGQIEGYAAIFNELSEDLGGFREFIRPGAFSATLERADVRALWNHDSNYVLGRNKAGTLALEEDDKGLRVSIDPPETQWANDLRESIRRGDVDQMSFGFTTIEDRWERQDGENVRELVEVELWDVSPVTFPAYTGTSVSARALTRVDELNSADDDIPDGAQGGESGEEDGGERSQGRLSRRRLRLELAKRKLGRIAPGGAR